MKCTAGCGYRCRIMALMLLLISEMLNSTEREREREEGAIERKS